MDYLPYVISVILGAVGACIVFLYGPKAGLMDFPNERSSHYTPTPKGGGIGILLAFLFVCLFAQIHFAFWLPVIIVALLGLYGDLNGFSPKLRLSMQFLIATALILSMENHFSNPFGKILLVPLWAVFIVGTANFYNFMDGVNGIAGITGVIGFGLLAIFIHFLEIKTPFFIIVICISLSCIGFLPFNVPRAKVFMGDVGSIFLGFTFAGLVFLFSKNLLDFVCLISFLFPFYADELTTMTIRIRDSENLTKPHRRHLYQFLANEKGISHWKISVGYGLFQIAVGMSVLLARCFGILVVLMTLVFYCIIFLYMMFYFRGQLENGLKES